MIDDENLRTSSCSHYFITNIVEVDYKCPQSLLLREMKFFQRYYDDAENSTPITAITVHCNVKTFKWLLDYIKAKSPETDECSVLQSLEVANVPSILVSAEFLEMASLVFSIRCLLYIIDRCLHTLLLRQL